MQHPLDALHNHKIKMGDDLILALSYPTLRGHAPDPFLGQGEGIKRTDKMSVPLIKGKERLVSTEKLLVLG
ncbi:MAG: hypothetical protein V1890_04145 [Candidatus Zixiibacteriota bacterium]